MKKKLLIALGITIILTLVGIWVYLLLFGTPKDTGEVFTNLGFGSGAGVIIDNNNTEEDNRVVVGRDPLQQLTTRPVAGSNFFVRNNQKIVRYVEKGTGYVFEINLENGQEIQITNTTIPLTYSAVFSTDNRTILYHNYIDGDKIVFAARLATTTGITDFIENISLPPNSDNIVFKDNNTIYYTLSENNKTTGYSFDLDTKVRTELFNTPLRQVTVVWGNYIDNIYLYPKTATELEGFVYEVTDNNLVPVTKEGKVGLAFGATHNFYYETYLESNRYKSKVTTADNNTYEPSLLLIPDKCSHIDIYALEFVCAVPTDNTNSIITDWYKGKLNTSDQLVFIDSLNQYYEIFVDLSEESGRQIDAFQLSTSESGLIIVFTNKIDNTLWLFDANLINN